MAKVESDRITETPTEARAGATGHHARTVLLRSTVGVAVLFAAVFVYFFA